jgi:hypothetical protein
MGKQFVVAGALAVSVAMLATACGGSSKSSSQATTSAATTSTVSTAATPALASAKNCRRLVALGSKIAQSVGASAKPNVRSVESEAAQVQALAKAAPSAVRGDVQTFADAFSSYAEAIKASGYKPGTVPTSAQIAKIAAAAKHLGTPKVARAIAHLTAWGKKNCSG